MIIDIIGDMVDAYEDQKKHGTEMPMGNKEWDIEYFKDWAERFEISSDPKAEDIAYRLANALERDDYKEFKKVCFEYMVELGYEGCWIWRHLKAMPIKAIRKRYLKD